MDDLMTAVWLQDGKIRVRTDVPLPKPLPGEALIRVLQAGICNTDLELVRGYYPYSGVLGHEFVGAVARGPEALLGQRVVGEINAVCGKCSTCRSGRPTHCDKRTVLGIVNRDGAFATFVTLPVENLHLVPPSISTSAATFVEPLAAALQIQQQVTIRPTDRVLVVGPGKLGQLIAQTLALTGCELLVVGRGAGRGLELLSARGICTGIVAEVETSAFDVAVECNGNADGFAVARRALRPRGTLVMKSTYAGDLTFNASALVVDEITLVGSRCGPFRPALRLLEDKRVQVEPLIEARYSLSDALTAFEHAQQPGALKVLLNIGEQ